MSIKAYSVFRDNAVAGDLKWKEKKKLHLIQ